MSIFSMFQPSPWSVVEILYCGFLALRNFYMNLVNENDMLHYKLLTLDEKFDKMLAASNQLCK